MRVWSICHSALLPFDLKGNSLHFTICLGRNAGEERGARSAHRMTDGLEAPATRSVAFYPEDYKSDAGALPFCPGHQQRKCICGIMFFVA